MRRMRGFAREFGAQTFEPKTAVISACGRYRYSLQRGDLTVVNLYGWRSTDPTDLEKLTEAVRIGPDNDNAILDAAKRADVTIAGWGGSLPAGGEARARDVLALLRRFGPVWCLGRTRSGQPRHPLYLPAGTALVRFDGGAPSAEMS